MTIKKRAYGRGHIYEIDGRKAPGVTTILGGTMPKPALVEWAGNVTAAYAVDHWDELSPEPPSKRLEILKKAKWAERDAAANRGTDVHALAEKYILDKTIEIPEALDGHVRSYEKFVHDFNVTPVHVEFVVAHRQVGYCGTVDLVADVLGRRTLLDLKTSRSGIFAETALQLTAYEHAEVYLDPQGHEQPMTDLGIEQVAAIHVTADGYQLIPIQNRDEIWVYFRHLAWLHRRADDLPTWLGRAVDAPRQRATA
jgi:hypothetical protein